MRVVHELRNGEYNEENSTVFVEMCRMRVCFKKEGRHTFIHSA